MLHTRHLDFQPNIQGVSLPLCHFTGWKNHSRDVQIGQGRSDWLVRGVQNGQILLLHKETLKTYRVTQWLIRPELRPRSSKLAKCDSFERWVVQIRHLEFQPSIQGVSYILCNFYAFRDQNLVSVLLFRVKNHNFLSKFAKCDSFERWVVHIRQLDFQTNMLKSVW